MRHPGRSGSTGGAVIALLLWAACGDNGTSDAKLDTARVVSTTMAVEASPYPIVVPLRETVEGETVIVALAFKDTSEGFPDSVGPERVTLNGTGLLHYYDSYDPKCSNHAEIWLSLGNQTRSGDGSLEIARDSPLQSQSMFRVYVVEATGLDTRTPSSTPPGFGEAVTATAPTLHVAAGSLVVSIMMTCNSMTSLVPGSPFTSIGPNDTSDVAYYTAIDEGAYGGAWSYAGGTWNAHTIAFRPAPSP